MKCVKLVRTIVGFWNVYDLESGNVVNLPPTLITQVFPGLDRKVRVKTAEVSEDQALLLGIGGKAVAV